MKIEKQSEFMCIDGVFLVNDIHTLVEINTNNVEEK